jgi:hypothetical protein
MAWIKRTTCAQCSRKLNEKDRQLGTICTPCVTGRPSIFDPKGDSDNSAGDRHEEE